MQPVEALRDVTLNIHEGEIFGLIGSNGAGKTTLIKIIATLVQPTSGKVTVKGHDTVTDDSRVRSCVGFANAEERSFYWRLSSEQNLLFFARLQGLSDRAAHKRIGELIELVDLGEYKRRRFGQLSTGNKQRLAVARALLTEPPVLLLDEPTRSLDPLAATHMRLVIRALVENTAVSILLTSHNLSEIEELCSHVAIISGGQIRAIDTPQGLRSSHRKTEKINIVLRGITQTDIVTVMEKKTEGLNVFERNGHLVASFNRAMADDTLDHVLRALHNAGASVIEIETEQSTLLEVLEGYSTSNQHLP
ncbi:MAG: ABC transporter ATP-binding protein [Pyrinomonadaceae bacterium]